MTTGKWMPRTLRNKEMIEDLRALWRAVQRKRPREVRIHHVRSHIRVPGNEIADWLADRGVGAQTTTVPAADRFIRQQLDSWREGRVQAPAQAGEPHASPPATPHLTPPHTTPPTPQSADAPT